MMIDDRPSLRDLLAGEVDLGFGVRIAPVTDEKKKLVAIRFSHDVYENGAEPVGVCSAILPLSKNKRRSFATLQAWNQWRLIGFSKKVGLRLIPSVNCTAHGVHGFVQNGKWVPIRVHLTEHIPPERWAKQVENAEDLAREFGGGYEGAIQALAWKSPYFGPRPDLTRPQWGHQSQKSPA